MEPNSNKPSFSVDRDDPNENHSKPRGSFQREPPVVPERVAVLKANYKQAWLYFLIGVCLVVAWGGIIRFAFIRAFALEDNDDLPRTSSTFLAIAYEGISESEKEVTPEVFYQQMETLSEAGYNTITLEDVNAFYQDGTLLPEKAILLTFDHSRKSSYFDARRVLKNYRWRAVMFVWTKPILDEDPAALRWPYIRAMINSGSWEAGAQSHLGFDQVLSDSEGQLNNFLTSPQWLSAENRYETPVEFEARLRADHKFVFDLITEETGYEPIAFAFPYGDFGQYDERALLTRRLNMDLVDEFYDLGFILGNAGLNTAFTNPLRLNRLLVDSDWNAEELLSRLEVSWPQELGADSEKLLSEKKRWQHDWGSFELTEEGLILKATESNTGAKVWANGTDLYRDFSAKIKLVIERGQAGIFLRSSKDGEAHLYLGLGDEGEVWLRQKMPGMESITLGTSRYEKELDGTVSLDLYARGNQFYVTASDEPLFNEIILTRGEDTPGLIGLSVWDPEVGVASLKVEQIEVRPFHNRLITWDPISTRMPYLAGWMSKNGYQYSMFSPPWLRFGLEGRAEQIGWNPTYYKDLSSVYNMQFVPEIIIERSESIDGTTATNIAEQAERDGADAVYCNLSNMTGGLNIAKVTSWLEKISIALAEKNIELIVSLPPTLQGGNTITSLFQGLTNLRIVFKEEALFGQSEFKPNDPRVITWNHAIIQQTKQPLFYQLTGGDAEEQLWGNEIRSHLLWEEGSEAYQKGDFDLAIDLWSRWAEIEPYNERPPRLVGDVYRSKKDYRNAVEYYQRSLELNPGQISLLITTANLRTEFEEGVEKPLEMLDLYARLFPQNSEVKLAQAEILLNDGQVEEARKKILEVVNENKGDLNALSHLHGLLKTSNERVQNLKKILDVAQARGMRGHFLESLDKFGLLLWPESWRLLDLVNQRAQEELPDSVYYQNLLPREYPVREDIQFGSISTNWKGAQITSDSTDEGRSAYSDNRDSSDNYLKLGRSSLIQNGFIEATLDQASGLFWLYARRSEGTMIRFGFEQTGDLHMQTWVDGKIVENLRRDWIRPVNPFTLRLEIRGDAAFGYLDEKPAFGAPISIPLDMNLGSWGMAPWTPESGLAQAVVREVAGGPLPTYIGIFEPKVKPWTDDDILAKLENNSEVFSVISPAWFRQNTNGEILLTSKKGDFQKTRLFTTYYKIRLYPMILSASTRNFDVENLIELSANLDVKGFSILFAKMPSAEWFQEIEDQLVGTGLGLLAIKIDKVSGEAEVREMGDVSGLFSGQRYNQDFDLIDVTQMKKPHVIVDKTFPLIEGEDVQGKEDRRSIHSQDLLHAPNDNAIYIF